MVDDLYMQQRIETAEDIVLGIMHLVFIPPHLREQVDYARAALLLQKKFEVQTPVEQIEADLREMRENSNKGATVLAKCIRDMGRRYGLPGC